MAKKRLPHYNQYKQKRWRSPKGSQLEDGYALFTIVLIIFIIGSLIIPPLLMFIGTGVNAGTIQERRMYELYAADAGFGEALVQLSAAVADNLSIPDINEFSLNNCDVNVNIEQIASTTYKISSHAIHNNGSETTIVSIVEQKSLLDNAITSNGDLDLKSGTWVGGDVSYNGTYTTSGQGANVTGQMTEQEFSPWPDFDDVSDFYLARLRSELSLDPGDPLPEYPDANLEISPSPVEPLFRNGDLDIFNQKAPKGNKTEKTRLTGTIYIYGDLTFPAKGSSYELDLNNQTIIVTGTVTMWPNITITGSGAIISYGSMDLSPNNIISAPGDFVLILSIGGSISYQPSVADVTFTGAIAAADGVDLKHGTYYWNPPPEDLDLFPFYGQTLKVTSWNINLN